MPFISSTALFNEIICYFHNKASFAKDLWLLNRKDNSTYQQHKLSVLIIEFSCAYHRKRNVIMLKKIIEIFCVGIILLQPAASMEKYTEDKEFVAINDKVIEFEKFWKLLPILPDEALKHLHIAADLGHPDAAKILEKMYEEEEKKYNQEPILSQFYRDMYESNGSYPKNHPSNANFFEPTTESSDVPTSTNTILSKINIFWKNELLSSNYFRAIDPLWALLPGIPQLHKINLVDALLKKESQNNEENNEKKTDTNHQKENHDYKRVYGQKECAMQKQQNYSYAKEISLTRVALAAAVPLLLYGLYKYVYNKE